MRASLKRRMMAYVIDILIVVLIATAVSFFLPTYGISGVYMMLIFQFSHNAHSIMYNETPFL